LLLLLFFACKEPTQAEREIMLWQLTEANDLCNQNTLQQLQVMRLISKGQENKGIEQVYSLSMAIWQRMQTLCSGYRNSKHVHPEHADTLSRDMQQLKQLIPACFGRAYYLKNAGYPGWTEPEPGNSEELKLARLHNNMSILFAVLRKSISFGKSIGYFLYTQLKPLVLIADEQDGTAFLQQAFKADPADLLRITSLHNVRILFFHENQNRLILKKTGSPAFIRAELFDTVNHCNYEAIYSL